MINVTVKIYGIGDVVEENASFEAPVSCREAVDLLVKDTAAASAIRYITYLRNGERALENDVLSEGDVLIAMNVMTAG